MLPHMQFDTTSFFAGLATALLPLLLALAASYGQFKQIIASVRERLDTIDERLEQGGEQDTVALAAQVKLEEWRHNVKNWQQSVEDRISRLEDVRVVRRSWLK